MNQHEVEMELAFAVARSKDKTCGICMEVVMVSWLSYIVLQHLANLNKTKLDVDLDVFYGLVLYKV